MTPEEFRQAGHALIDWIADYRTDLEKRPVRAQIKPGEVSASFPRSTTNDTTSRSAITTGTRK